MKHHLRTISDTGMVCLGFAIYSITRITVLTKRLILRIAGLFVFFVLTALYLLSLPVPFLGRVLLESESRIKLPEIKVADRVETFREDIMEIMIQKHAPASGRDSRDLKTEIEYRHAEAKKKHELGEIAFSFWGGIIVLILGASGYFEYVTYVLSVYLVVLTISILVRLVMIDLLAYNNLSDEGYIRKRELELRLGWQRAVLASTRSQLAILFLGCLGLFHSLSYEKAKDWLEKYYEKNMKTRKWMRVVLQDMRGRIK